MSWVREDGGDAVCRVRIQPRASRDEIAGPLGDALKIRIQSPPVDGKANKALTRFLARRLSVAASRITIESGASSRSKRVRVAGLSAKQVAARLEPGAASR